jgi:hypothetical protein
VSLLLVASSVVFDPSTGFPYPRYPDIARGLTPQPKNNLTGYAYTPAINRWGVDGGQMPWLPVYPDFTRKTPFATDDRTSYSFYNYEATVFNPSRGFPYPGYPDFARGKIPQPINNLTGYAYTPALDRWGIDGGQIPWVPIYPDIVRGLRPLPVFSLFTLGYTPAVNRWGIDGGQIPWVPIYPDFARKLPNPTNNLTGYGYTPAVDRWGIDGGKVPWIPTYPDFARKAPNPVNNLTGYGYTPAIDRWGIDGGQIPWVPVFPDFPGRKAPNPVFNLSGYAFLNWKPFEWIPSLQTFYPTYPDFARKLPVPNYSLTSYSFLDWQPFVGVFDPKDGFPYPGYPDFARKLPPQPVNNLTGYGYVPAIDRWGIDGGQTPWIPVYPDFARRAPNPVENITNFAFFNFEGAFFNPSRGFPYPAYPDFARKLPPQPVNNLTGYAFLNYQALLFDPAKGFPYPAFPDFARKAPNPVENITNFAFFNFEGAFFNPSRGFPYPAFPDFARKLPPLPIDSLTTFSFLNYQALLFDPAKGFPYPAFPDFARKLPNPVNNLTSYSFYDLQVFIFDPSGGFPYPAYPDFARALPLQPKNNLTGYAYVPTLDTWGLDGGKLPWLPDYPDFARGLKPLPVSNLFGYAYVPAVSNWGLDAGQMPWRGVYPDFARAAPRPQDNLRSYSFVPLVPFEPERNVGWHPVYPDFARKAPNPVNNLTGYTFQMPIVGVTLLRTATSTGVFNARATGFTFGFTPFQSESNILVKALQLPLPPTQTTGIFQSDVMIRSAIIAAIADIRANPWLLNYVFAGLLQDTLTFSQYGNNEIDKARQWFTRTNIPVVINTQINDPVVPSITISLVESVETENTLGDVNSDVSEDVDPSYPNPWPILAGPFTPCSYASATGIMVLPAEVAALVTLGAGMVIADKFGETYPILEVLDSTTIAIEPGIAADFTNALIKTTNPTYAATLEKCFI